MIASGAQIRREGRPSQQGSETDNPIRRLRSSICHVETVDHGRMSGRPRSVLGRNVGLGAGPRWVQLSFSLCLPCRACSFVLRAEGGASLPCDSFFW